MTEPRAGAPGPDPAPEPEAELATARVPASLLDAELSPVWSQVRLRLEANGAEWRGSTRLAELTGRRRHLLSSLLGRPASRMLDLGELEVALRERHVGDDLASSLRRLGHPVSDEPEQRRLARAAAADGRAAVRERTGAWPEPWAAEWADEVIRVGLVRGMDRSRSVEFVRSVRLVLDELARLDPTTPTSRTDLAATLLGDSHALDTGTRVEAGVVRALVLAHQMDDPDAGANGAGSGDSAAPPVAGAGSRAWWEFVGAPTDLVSAPVLCWGLALLGDGPSAQICRAATLGGVPVHLSQLALRTDPAVVEAGTRVLLVENPRLVEAAAQRRHPVAVVATNGNPSSTVSLLVSQLLDCGAALHHHGDFDAAGLAITARLYRRGVHPWRMDAEDYLRALADAATAGVELPTDDRAAPDTPWDPTLRTLFDEHRRIVHEERLLDELLELLDQGGGSCDLSPFDE